METALQFGRVWAIKQKTPGTPVDSVGIVWCRWYFFWGGYEWFVTRFGRLIVGIAGDGVARNANNSLRQDPVVTIKWGVGREGERGRGMHAPRGQGRHTVEAENSGSCSGMRFMVLNQAHHELQLSPPQPPPPQTQTTMTTKNTEITEKKITKSQNLATKGKQQPQFARPPRQYTGGHKEGGVGLPLRCRRWGRADGRAEGRLAGPW